MKFLYHILAIFSLLGTQFCLSQNKTDEKGRKQGYWEKIDPVSKKIIYKGNFKDDKPQGMFTYYYKDMDSIRTKMEFRQDGKIGYAKLYYMSGKLEAAGKYIGEQKDSVWNFYDDAGVLISTDHFTNGKKNGPSKIFLPNGKLAEEKNYKDGKLNGPFKQYIDGKRVKAEGAYLNDNFDGKCSWYYPNGFAAAQGVYSNGTKKGVWIYKDKDGKVQSKEVWVNGKQLSDKEMEEYFKKNKPAAEEPKKEAAKPATKKPSGKK
ncbi:MAG: toxin-antitoxin system YwqK family antitoxin [Bacteroidia bacterium]